MDDLWMSDRFKNRIDAGRLLAERLKHRTFDQPLLLALSKGGVSIGSEVSRITGIPLDVLLIRPIKTPRHPEYAIGAITENGYFRVNPRLMRRLGLQESEIESVIVREREELKRRSMRYRTDRPLPPLGSRDVIVVDDGLMVGAVAEVACEYLRELGANRIVLAVPICTRRLEVRLRAHVDELLCLRYTEGFSSISFYYDSYEYVADDEAIRLLVVARELGESRNLGDGTAFRSPGVFYAQDRAERS